MEVLSNTAAASSDEEDIIVCKRNANQSASRRAHCFDSDDDSLPHQNACQTASDSSNSDSRSLKSPVPAPAPITDTRSIHNYDDTNDSEGGSGHADTKENKIPRKRVIRDQVDSDEETRSTTFFQKSQPQMMPKHKVIDSDSDSDAEIQIKPTRFRQKDKMMEKIRKTFENQNEKIHNIMKPLSELCDESSASEAEETAEALDESICNIKRSYKSGSKSQRQRKIIKQIENVSKSKPMSTKEAMENMTKIKSESSRMLREKRVTLPYHRPRQLSLKEILARKRPDVASQRNLSFKMNEVQLQQYADRKINQFFSKLPASDVKTGNKTLYTLANITATVRRTLHLYIEMKNRIDLPIKLQLEESQKQMSELYKSDDEEDDIETEHKNISVCTQICQNSQSNNVNSQIDDDSNKEKLEKELPSLETNNIAIVNGSMKSLDNVTNETDASPVILNDITSENQLDTKASTLTPVSLENANLDSQNILLHFSENTEMINEERNCEPKVNENSSESEEKAIEYNTSIDVAEKSNSIAVCETLQDSTASENKSSEINELNENEKKSTERMSFSRLSDSSNNEENKSMDDIEKEQDYSFDDDFPSDDIDELMNKIDNGKDVTSDSPMLMDIKPQLSGAPGMLIDLDEPTAARAAKHSGVELLKRRYIYFSQLKTQQQEDDEEEQKMKPGAKHLMLKHELERQIAEQSIAEWNKRLEEERVQQRETMAINGELSDCEDELEKMDKACQQKDADDNNDVEDDKLANDNLEVVNNDGADPQDKDEVDELGEEEEEEEEFEEKDSKAKSKTNSNPLIDDEAEVDDDDDADGSNDEDNDADESESSDESSSEEEDLDRKLKKGRIIKAFEDSDDEDQRTESDVKTADEKQLDSNAAASSSTLQMQTPDMFESQITEGDEDIPLAQPVQSNSEDMNESFPELMSARSASKDPVAGNHNHTAIFETQTTTQVDMEAIVGICSGKFATESEQDVPPVPPSIPGLYAGDVATQVIGEDILQMCSGKFGEDTIATQAVNDEKILEEDVAYKKNCVESLFEELDGPQDEAKKTNKFFEADLNINTCANTDGKKERVLQKGKLVIESSDEEKEGHKENNKKKKRKKLDKRKLLISDDEEEISEGELSALEDEDMEKDGERVVEYDSEENEVCVSDVRAGKYKGAVHELMDREAELSSEDEWAGSGDEDERGLDRMEREAGDDDVFHQGRLRRELGQMHVQDLMDQDKREVRMLQEILLEDGDLAGGSRQRKFRWKNDDGEEQPGTVPDEFGDTPDDERESEEQWRRQRHERQLYLRQLDEKQKSEGDFLGVGLDSAVAASHLFKRVSSTSLDATGGAETVDGAGELRQGVVDKKQSAKELPSPVKNSFTIMHQQYRALVSGNARSSLQRLAALVEPASEKPVHNVSSLAAGKHRTFVFTTLTQPEPQELLDDAPTQKKKRKAMDNVGTPKLIKKLRVEEKPRKSILNHL